MQDDILVTVLFSFAFGAIFAACLWGDEFTPNDYEQTTLVCESNQGVKVVKDYFLSKEVTCNNSAIFVMKKTI